MIMAKKILKDVLLKNLTRGLRGLNGLRKFVYSNWTLSEKLLLCIDILLFGVLLGWLTSPFRSKHAAPYDIEINCAGADVENEEKEEDD